MHENLRNGSRLSKQSLTYTCHDKTQDAHHNKCDGYKSRSNLTFHIRASSMNMTTGVERQLKKRKISIIHETTKEEIN